MQTRDAPAPVLRFFAGVKIDVTPALRELLRELGDLGNSVRPVREDQLHVTLKFFGDVAEDVAPKLAEEIAAAVLGLGEFDWKLRGTGAFPSVARPSVVWAGVDDDGRFAILAEQVERVGASHGFAREARLFRPHVTLGRVKFRPPAALGELLRRSAAESFGTQRAIEVILFRSELGRGGSVYTPLHVAKL